MPAHDGLRLDEHEHVGPSRPASAQRYPEPTIDGGNARTPAFGGQRADLLAERQVLEHEVRTPANQRAKRTREEQTEANHDGASLYPCRYGNVNDL
jgi:hypothetical protein